MERNAVIVLIVVGLTIAYAIIRAMTGKPRMPKISADTSRRHVNYRQGVTDSSFDSGASDGNTQTFRSLAEMPYELRRNVGEALHGKAVGGHTAIDPELARKDFAERRAKQAKNDSV